MQPVASDAYVYVGEIRIEWWRLVIGLSLVFVLATALGWWLWRRRSDGL